MFKALVSAALLVSPLAFAEEPMPGAQEPAAPAKDAAPAKPAKGHHHKGGHHGHKAEGSTEAPSK